MTGAWKGEPMKSNKSALARVRRMKVKYSCGRKYGIRYSKRWCDELGEAARPRPKKEVELTVSSIYAWKTKTLFLQKSDS